jgi:acyl carrier protein
VDERLERLKRVLVEGLHLEVAPEDVDPDEPLFGGRLGLDSVDALELVMEIERNFGVQLQDDAESRKVLHSLRTIAEHIAARSG